MQRGKRGGALGSQRFKSLMVAPPGQELRQCLTPAPGQPSPHLHECPTCWWGLWWKWRHAVPGLWGLHHEPRPYSSLLISGWNLSSPFSGLGSPYYMCLTQKLLSEQCQDLLLPGYTWLSPASHHEEDWPSVEMGSQHQHQDGWRECAQSTHGLSEDPCSSKMLKTGNLVCLWNLEKKVL